ncbi:energy transducer TonB [Ottowia sp.]|uniref:energy transducer TonB n=1 Tax=Ottowia sp. TaxID=1898956 RepID=UPI0025D5F870|nr:energy transducer TonB [Ottowia sp.]
MTALAPFAPPTLPTLGRNAVVVGVVLALHGAALWALQAGLSQRPPEEVVIPAQLLAEFVAPPPAAAPAPAPTLAPPPTPAPPPPKPRPVAKQPAPRKVQAAPAPAPAPQPLAVAEAAPTAPVMAAPAPTAPVADAAPSPAATDTRAAPAAAPAPPAVVQPSSRAAYLNNPAPAYPAMSRRLGESGRVVVRVLIGPDGRAREAHIQKSSGYERLDQVALETARDRWRYVPGTRGGVPEAMWFNVPLNFVLE